MSASDKTPPAITSVVCLAASKVTFSEQVDAATAALAANYAINNGITVYHAAVSGNSVTLTTGTLEAGVTYTLTVNNVKDMADNTIAAGSSKTFQYVVFTGWQEDFEDGTADGWVTGGGTWSVTGGAYTNSGSGRAAAGYGGESFTDITYTADVTPVSGLDVWLIFRVQDAGNYYLFSLAGGSGKGELWKLGNGFIPGT